MKVYKGVALFRLFMPRLNLKKELHYAILCLAVQGQIVAAFRSVYCRAGFRIQVGYRSDCGRIGTRGRAGRATNNFSGRPPHRPKYGGAVRDQIPPPAIEIN